MNIDMDVDMLIQSFNMSTTIQDTWFNTTRYNIAYIGDKSYCQRIYTSTYIFR
jgi:hypothetical protein